MNKNVAMLAWYMLSEIEWDWPSSTVTGDALSTECDVDVFVTDALMPRRVP